MADGTDPMNDPAIDRALREALDVSLSPDFIARVRMRVASERAPRSLWGRWAVWTPVAAGALVAAAVVVMMVVQPTWKIDLRPDTTTGPKASAAADVRLPAAVVQEGTSVSTATVRPKPGSEQVRVKPATTLSRRTEEPEVLIAQDEAAALRRLLARASEGQIIGASLVADASDVAGDLMPPEITISPIKIDPLIPGNGEEGVRQ